VTRILWSKNFDLYGAATVSGRARGGNSFLIWVCSRTICPAFEVIEMGQSRFIFVPLCGKKFRWDEHIKDKTKV